MGLFCCESLRSNPSYISVELAIPRVDTFAMLFEQYVQQKMVECHCPGSAIVIVTDSSVRSMRGYGVRSTQTGAPVDAHTLFRLASVSKSFGAVLTYLEMKKGLLRFEDHVDQYLPDFQLSVPDYTDKVTINHLLSHSAGFPYHSYTNLVERGYTLASILPKFHNILNLEPPGSAYAYQNASFALIEPILEKVTHRSIQDLYEQDIKNILCMSDICFSYDDMCGQPNRALPHRLTPDRQSYVPVDITQKYYNTLSAGGVNASISDMSIWLKLLMGQIPEVLSSKAIDSLFSPQIKTTTDRRYYNFWPGVKDTYYARGMRLLDYGDHYRYYHGGFVNDYRSEIAIDPRTHTGICALFNATCCLSDDIVPTFFAWYEEWMDGCR